MAVIVPTAISAAMGIGKLVQGFSNTKKAKRMASAKRPQYDIPQTEYDNLDLLTSRASSGLSGSTKQLYLDQADRGLGTSISAILQGGGSANSVADLYSGYLDGINKVSLADDAAKLNNIDNMINARYRQSGYEDKKWQVNEFAPWADQQKQAAQLLALGQGQKDAGINTLGSSLMSGFNALSNNQDVASIGKSMGGGATGGDAGRLAGGGGLDGSVDSTGMSYPYSSGMSPFDISASLPNTDNPRQPLSPDVIGGTPFYGLDVSQMKGSDALMIQNLLYGR